MGTKYYELILSGRQLALLLAGFVALLGVAFVLGVGVGVQEPVARSAAAIPVAPAWEPPVVLEPTVAPLVTLPAGTPEVAAQLGAEVAAVTPTAVPPTTVPAATAAPVMPTAAVTAEEVAKSAPPPVHWVQVAALSRQELADGVRQRVVALGFRPEQVVVRQAGAGFRVRLGPFPDDASARRVVSRLRAQGFADAFPVTE